MTARATGFLGKLEPEAAARQLRRLFPELAPIHRVELIGEGFSSFVLLVEDETVFRVAKHGGVYARYRLEAALLPRLAPKLPVRVPEPAYLAASAPSFPFGLIGYPKLTGIPWRLEATRRADEDALARDLAAFMFALHTQPLEGLDCPELPPNDLDEALAFVQGRLPRSSADRLTALLEVAPGHPALTHGDLWAENLLLNGAYTQLVGVIDFEGLAVADIARDFAPHAYIGQAFLERVKTCYEQLGGSLGDNFGARLSRARLERELAGLSYALHYPASGELADSLAKVRRVLA